MFTATSQVCSRRTMTNRELCTTHEDISNLLQCDYLEKCDHPTSKIQSKIKKRRLKFHTHKVGSQSTISDQNCIDVVYSKLSSTDLKDLILLKPSNYIVTQDSYGNCGFHQQLCETLDKPDEIPQLANGVKCSENNNLASLHTTTYHKPLNEVVDEVKTEAENTSLTSPGPSHFAVLTMNLSFAGSGFLGMYHLGVAKALAQHGSRLLINIQRFTGASAGSLVAAVLAIRGPDLDALQKSEEFTRTLAIRTRQKKLGVMTPRYSLLKPLESFLHELCPEEGYKTASGRLYISLTKHGSRTNVAVSQFTSNEHLIQCLLASAYIPFVTGTGVSKIGGQKYFDGGFSDNLPILDSGRTITVSPFCGKEDICPTDSHSKAPFTHMGTMRVQLSADNGLRGIHALFPPKERGLETYYKRGFQDAIRFLKSEGFYENNQEHPPA